MNVFLDPNGLTVTEALPEPGTPPASVSQDLTVVTAPMVCPEARAVSALLVNRDSAAHVPASVASLSDSVATQGSVTLGSVTVASPGEPALATAPLVSEAPAVSPGPGLLPSVASVVLHGVPDSVVKLPVRLLPSRSEVFVNH